MAREKHDKKEALIRIVKRGDIARGKAWIIRLSSVLLALITGGLLILALGHNPFTVYADMAKGSLATGTARIGMLKIAIPLLGTALALAPAFKMRFWNIGAEGQILMGAIFASYFALFCADRMPSGLLIFVMFIAGAVGGGIWGLIPAVFKARWNTNETLFTLMLNYIALGIVNYLRTGPWKDPSNTYPKIAMFDDAARLPSFLGVNAGWVLVVLLTIGMYIYMKYTKQGYEISVVGESERTAAYAGMSVSKIIMRTMFISGAIAGVVGVIIVSGNTFTLSENTTSGYGFTAITVAWLAALNPFAMVVISIFLAVLTKGANTIQTNFKIPASASEVLTGLILFFLLACEFFISYKLVFRKKHHSESGAALKEAEHE